MGTAPTALQHRFFATTSRTAFSPILRILSRRATRLSAAASRRPHAPPQHRFRLKLRADRAPPPDDVSQRRVRVPPRIDTHPGCGAGVPASGATARRRVARFENALSRCHCTGCTGPRNWAQATPAPVPVDAPADSDENCRASRVTMLGYSPDCARSSVRIPATIWDCPIGGTKISLAQFSQNVLA